METAPQAIRVYAAEPHKETLGAEGRGIPLHFERRGVGGRSCATGPKGPSSAGGQVVGLKPDYWGLDIFHCEAVSES